MFLSYGRPLQEFIISVKIFILDLLISKDYLNN